MYLSGSCNTWLAAFNITLFEEEKKKKREIKSKFTCLSKMEFKIRMHKEHLGGGDLCFHNDCQFLKS